MVLPYFVKYNLIKYSIAVMERMGSREENRTGVEIIIYHKTTLIKPEALNASYV